jgi:DNA-binding HxlR family transcriptional regulator
MVVIDVLAKVRKPSGNKPVYESDYEALTGLCKLGHELGIAIVVVHHTRKMASDDLMETVNGSYGITGAVDTVIVMADKAGGAVLDIRGRDVEAAELAIQFSKDACRWTILGNAAEVHQSDQRKTIIAALAESTEPMRVNELVAATGMKRNALDLLLGKMVRDGLIKRVGRGQYAHKDYVPPESVRSVRPVRRTDRFAANVIDLKAHRDYHDLSDLSDLSAQAHAESGGSAGGGPEGGNGADGDERVKNRTDQTERPIDAQAAEDAEIL